jgi:hypothetical protein
VHSQRTRVVQDDSSVLQPGMNRIYIYTVVSFTLESL